MFISFIFEISLHCARCEGIVAFLLLRYCCEGKKWCNSERNSTNRQFCFKDEEETFSFRGKSLLISFGF